MLALLGALALCQQPVAPQDTIHLTVRASPVPTPSVRYRLLAEQDNLTGNAAVLYLRPFAYLQEYKTAAKLYAMETITDPQGNETTQVEQWLRMPVKELPLQEVSEFVRHFHKTLQDFEQAARMRNCDWNLNGRPDGPFSVNPEAHTLRRWSMILGVKAKCEIAQGKFDDALGTIQVGLGLGRHLAKGPSLLHSQIGLVCARDMLVQVEALLAAAPQVNLYWALTELPAFDLENAHREEQQFLPNMFPELRDLEKEAWSAKQIASLEARIRKWVGALGMDAQRWEARHAAIIAGAAREARVELVAQGMDPAEVEALPRLQAALLYAYREERRTFAEMDKWRHVPYWQARKHWSDALADYQKAMARLDLILMQGALERLGIYDSHSKAHLNTLRFQRRINLLRTVEALRAHAAAHQGRLPAKLEEITTLPLPLDPLTGQPFSYTVKENQAILDAPDVIDPGLGARAMRYVLTFKK